MTPIARLRLAILLVAISLSAIAAACSGDSGTQPTPVPKATATVAPTPATTASPELALADPQDVDRAALVALYEATGAANWLNKDNWLSEAPLDEWYGLTVDGNGRVIELALFENQLSGEIPPELGNLSNLQGLYLSDNQLSGQIPSELGSLSSLRPLAIDGNRLTGAIPPELGALSDLLALYLSENPLNGCIPEGLRGIPDNDYYQLGLPICGASGTVPSPSVSPVATPTAGLL